jgi:hypothetical protein
MNGLLNSTGSNLMSRVLSLRRQWSENSFIVKNYSSDIRIPLELFKKFNVKSGHLGEALKLLGQHGQLFSVIKNDNFEVVNTRQLSDETVEYLNFIEYDKLYCCRFCYTHIDWLWCEFHRHHVYRQRREIENSSYVDFLNSDMAVIMFVEEYYFFLSSCHNKKDARSVLKSLINFDTLSHMMQAYGFEVESIDKSNYELMDLD